MKHRITGNYTAMDTKTQYQKESLTLNVQHCDLHLTLGISFLSAVSRLTQNQVQEAVENLREPCYYVQVLYRLVGG